MKGLERGMRERGMRLVIALMGVLMVLLIAAPSVVHAQQGQKHGGAQHGHQHKPPPSTRGTVSIDIRAQVPVPQVVTVRPRAIPAFHADALDTVFVDERRGTSLRVPYQAVPLVAFPQSSFRSSFSSPPTDSLKER